MGSPSTRPRISPLYAKERKSKEEKMVGGGRKNTWRRERLGVNTV